MYFLSSILTFTLRHIGQSGSVLRCAGGNRSAIFIALIVWTASPAIARGAYMLVNGQLSNNVVRIDLDTGASSVFATYPTFAAAKELAMDSQGNVYSSTLFGNRNVVKFVPQPGTDVLTAVDFTPDIFFFGPGQIQFHQGDLYVAGGRRRVIFQYDGQTGEEIRSFSVTTAHNIRALAIEGDDLYYAEIFQKRVRKMDLTQNPPTGGTLLQDFVRLVEPISMAIGGNGNLLFTRRAGALVPEYDPDTGAFVRTFVDLTTLGVSDIVEIEKAIKYDPGLDNYFISAGHKVFRFDPDGTLLRTYESPFLQDAYGILVVPEPGTLALLLVGLVPLVLVARRRRR